MLPPTAPNRGPQHSNRGAQQISSHSRAASLIDYNAALEGLRWASATSKEVIAYEGNLQI